LFMFVADLFQVLDPVGHPLLRLLGVRRVYPVEQRPRARVINGLLVMRQLWICSLLLLLLKTKDLLVIEWIMRGNEVFGYGRFV
jgi:hypothetical protein